MDSNFNNTQAALTGASGPLRLRTKTYQFTPFTDRDIVELDTWVQEKVISLAQNQIDSHPDMPDESKDRLLRIAFKEARNLMFCSREGTEYIKNIGGMARVVQQGIKAEHPDVTVEELVMELRDKQGLANAGTWVMSSIKRLSSMLSPSETEGGTDTSGKKSQQRKRRKTGKQKGRRGTRR